MLTLPPEFWTSAFGSCVFGVIGIVLICLGLACLELLTRKINIQEQLEKDNRSVAAVVVSMILGLSYIIAHVVH